MAEIRPAAEVDMLAVVDGLAGRLIDERTGPPAPSRTRLEQRYAKAPLAKRCRRRESRQAAPNDDHMVVHEKRAKGIEPSTSGLGSQCSTTELRPHTL